MNDTRVFRCLELELINETINFYGKNKIHLTQKFLLFKRPFQ